MVCCVMVVFGETCISDCLLYSVSYMCIHQAAAVKLMQVEPSLPISHALHSYKYAGQYCSGIIEIRNELKQLHKIIKHVEL